MSFNIEERTITIELFRSSAYVDNSVDCGKIKEFQLGGISTHVKLSINALMEELKPIVMGKKEKLKIGIFQNYYHFFACLEDYQNFDAKLKIHHFSIE